MDKTVEKNSKKKFSVKFFMLFAKFWADSNKTWPDTTLIYGGRVGIFFKKK